MAKEVARFNDTKTRHRTTLSNVERAGNPVVGIVGNIDG
jgi:hypothetical protein